MYLTSKTVNKTTIIPQCLVAELAMATEAMFQKKDEDDDKEIVEILAHAIGKSLIEKKDEFFDALHRAILVC